jgi:TM2 domain-containing membrane protein YozV
MSRVLQHLPEIEGDEQMYVARLMKGMSDEQAEQFAHVYRAQRRDPTTILLLALLGFIVIAGVHRFYLDQIGMGLLYLFTGGLCLIGTIIDLVRYRELAFKYNQRKAEQAADTVRSTVDDE